MNCEEKSALLALAEACEKASGPDRELDCRVWAAIGKAGASFEVAVAVVPDFTQWLAPVYTASLDAAMTLVPEGWDKGAQDMGEDGCFAEVWRHGWHDDTVLIAQARSMALAVCAAALRAQAGAAQ